MCLCLLLWEFKRGTRGVAGAGSVPVVVALLLVALFLVVVDPVQADRHRQQQRVVLAGAVSTP